MRLFRFFISFLALVGVGAATASPPADKIAQRTSEPFAGYNRACGYPIIFRSTSTISFARIDPQLGPIIVLDPLLTYPSEAAHRRFLIAHECAHHRLGHTQAEGLRRRAFEKKGVEDQELSADCWAAETLAAAELPQEVRFIVDRFYRKGLHSPGSGYPSGVQRSSLIYHCLKSVQRKRSATNAK